MVSNFQVANYTNSGKNICAICLLISGRKNGTIEVYSKFVPRTYALGTLKTPKDVKSLGVIFLQTEYFFHNIRPSRGQTILCGNAVDFLGRQTIEVICGQFLIFVFIFVAIATFVATLAIPIGIVSTAFGTALISYMGSQSQSQQRPQGAV